MVFQWPAAAPAPAVTETRVPVILRSPTRSMVKPPLSALRPQPAESVEAVTKKIPKVRTPASSRK